MKLIKLNRGQEELWVNPSLITSIDKYVGHMSRVFVLGDEGPIIVDQTPEEIVELINQL